MDQVAIPCRGKRRSCGETRCRYAFIQPDVIRRAISKKYEKLIAEHRVKFREGCVANGIPADKADEIYAAIEFFANYGFNKAHAADYAVITCQTAYLKAKYPVEYMTALLTVEQNNTDKVSVFLAECRRLGIPVLPPDVNASDLDFVIQDDYVPEERGVGQPLGDSVCALSAGAIRFGMGAVKNVSAGAVREIVRARGRVVIDVRRAKQQIRSFALRHGLDQPTGWV